MKNLKTIFGVFIIASFIFTSCGGVKKEESKGVTIKPKSTSIKGDLGDFFTVVDKDYVVKEESMGGLISVEVKRTEKDFDFPVNNINPFGTNGSEDYHVGFGIELLGDSGPLEVKQATEGGMGGVYSSEDVTGLMKLKKGETGYIRWSVSKLEGLKSFQLLSAKQKEEQSKNLNSSNSNTSESNSDCDKFIKDYENFADSYIKLLKKYKANPADASILTEYTEAVQKATDMQTNASNCTDMKYATKLTAIANKIAKAAM